MAQIARPVTSKTPPVITLFPDMKGGTMAAHKQWTTTDLRQLEKWYEGGWMLKEIADEFGVSVSSVGNQIKKIRKMRSATPTVGKKWTHEEDRHLREIWNDANHTKEDACSMFGVSYYQLYYRAKALGLQTGLVRGRKWMAPGTTKRSPWPKNMPNFEDHPVALAQDAQFSELRALRTYLRHTPRGVYLAGASSIESAQWS